MLVEIPILPLLSFVVCDNTEIRTPYGWRARQDLDTKIHFNAKTGISAFYHRK
jgi:hypothetical protein